MLWSVFFVLHHSNLPRITILYGLTACRSRYETRQFYVTCTRDQETAKCDFLLEKCGMFLHVNPHSYISLKPRVRVKRVLFSVVVVGFVLSVGVRKKLYVAETNWLWSRKATFSSRGVETYPKAKGVSHPTSLGVISLMPSESVVLAQY